MKSKEFEPYIRKRKQSAIAKKFAEIQKAEEIKALVQSEIALQKDEQKKVAEEIKAAEAKAESVQRQVVIELAAAEKLAEKTTADVLEERKNEWRLLQHKTMDAAIKAETDAKKELDDRTTEEKELLNKYRQALIQFKINAIIYEICKANVWIKSTCDTKKAAAEAAELAVAVADGACRSAKVARDKRYEKYLSTIQYSYEAQAAKRTIVENRIFLVNLFEKEQARLLNEGVINQSDIENNKIRKQHPDSKELKWINTHIGDAQVAALPAYREQIRKEYNSILEKLETESREGFRYYVPSGTRLPADDEIDRIIVTLSQIHKFKPFLTARGSPEVAAQERAVAEEREHELADKLAKEEERKRVNLRALTPEEAAAYDAELLKTDKEFRNAKYEELKTSYFELIQANFVYFITEALYSEVNDIQHLDKILVDKILVGKLEYDRKFAAFQKAETEKNRVETEYKTVLQVLQARIALIDSKEVGKTRREIDGANFKREWVVQMQSELYRRSDDGNRNSTDGIIAIMESWISKRYKTQVAPFQKEINRIYNELYKESKNFDIPDELVNETIKDAAELINLYLCNGPMPARVVSPNLVRPQQLPKLFCDRYNNGKGVGIIPFNIENYQPPRPPSAPVSKGLLGLGLFGLGGSRKVRGESSRKTLKKRRVV